MMRNTANTSHSLAQRRQNHQWMLRFSTEPSTNVDRNTAKWRGTIPWYSAFTRVRPSLPLAFRTPIKVPAITLADGMQVTGALMTAINRAAGYAGMEVLVLKHLLGQLTVLTDLRAPLMIYAVVVTKFITTRTAAGPVVPNVAQHPRHDFSPQAARDCVGSDPRPHHDRRRLTHFEPMRSIAGSSWTSIAISPAHLFKPARPILWQWASWPAPACVAESAPIAVTLLNA